MDFNRNAHPDCVYAENPFHECASACLERIAQGHGKKNTKKQSTFSVFLDQLFQVKVYVFCILILVLFYYRFKAS